MLSILYCDQRDSDLLIDETKLLQEPFPLASALMMLISNIDAMVIILFMSSESVFQTYFRYRTEIYPVMIYLHLDSIRHEHYMSSDHRRYAGRQ